MQSRTTKSLVTNALNEWEVEESLGQHFLFNSKDAAEVLKPIKESSILLEVGPGPGSLTLAALQAGHTIIAVEIDIRWVNYLNENFKQEIESGRLEIIHGDILTYPLQKKIDWIIGNINYAITSPLLGKLENHFSLNNSKIFGISLLIQKEVAERLHPETSPRMRSSLGTVLSLCWDIEIGKTIHSHKFMPQPKVHGKVIILRPKSDFKNLFLFDLTRCVIRAGYSNRRKQLHNALLKPPDNIKKILKWERRNWKEVIRQVVFFEKHDVSHKRAEELTRDEWINLSEDILSKYNHLFSK